MNFQIESLIVWPTTKKLAPRVVRFRLGAVNVITGASRTGKSAIIPIIDYCLGSSDCSIPIDTIRDFASWYGVIVKTDSEKILFARKVPVGNKVSNEFYIERGTNITVPPWVRESNETAERVKLILNTISATPAFSLGEGDDQNYRARLSFRDLTAFQFQSQDIIANQNILFYKTHAHEHRERLRNWFPYILGAENIETLRARNRLKVIDMELRRLNRELDEVKKASDSWLRNIKSHLNVAREYGLLGEEFSDESESGRLVEIARGILEDIPDSSSTTETNVLKANKELSKLEGEEEVLSTEIAKCKTRLANLDRLRESFSDYGGGVKRRRERLQISQWLEDVSMEAKSCPACGSTDHESANSEMKKISAAFRRYESDVKKVAEVPTSFDREEQLLRKELSELLEAKLRLSQRFDFLVAKDREARKEFQRGKEMFLFIGHLKASIELLESARGDGTISKRIESLTVESNALRSEISEERIAARLSRATSEICQRALEHLVHLDLEEKYKRVPPRLSVKDLTVSVQSGDGSWHLLSEVGSASNWVSFHLAMMCGLQEFFAEQANSVVPSFVIFDQPSQVYFPKLKRGEEAPDDQRFEDEDVSAVKSMFTTLARSVAKSNFSWQAIVLDHADNTVYGNVAGVHEVEEWRNGTKLIPENWFLFEGTA